MLSKYTHKGLRKYFQVVSKLNLLCFRWCDRTNKLEVTRNKWKLIAGYLSAISTIANGLFTTSCLVNGLLSGERKPENLVVDTIFSVGFTLFGVCELNILWMKYEFADLMNQILTIDNDFAGTARHGWVKPQLTDGCDYFICFFVFAIFLTDFMEFALFLQNPMNPRYGYYLLPTAGDNYWTLLLWIPYELYQGLKIPIVFDFYCFLILIYTNSTNFWLQRINPQHGDRHYCTRGGMLRQKRVILKGLHPSQSLRSFKILHVLNQHFNYCCSRLFWPTFKFITTSIHVLSIVVTLRLAGVISPPAYAMFPLGCITLFYVELVVFRKLGLVYTLSKEFLRSSSGVQEQNKGSRKRRLMRKMSPLKIRVNGLYLMKKSTVLTVLQIVVSTTINLIICI